MFARPVPGRGHARHEGAVFGLGLLAALPLLAATLDEEDAAAENVVRLDDLSLSIDLSTFDGVEDAGEMFEQLYDHAWVAELDGVELLLVASEFDAAEWGIGEPEDVTSTVRFRLEQGAFASYRFASRRLLEGAYGAAPYAALLHMEQYERTSVSAETYALAGITIDKGWSFQVFSDEKLGTEPREKLLAFFAEGFAYDGELRDPEWTDDEVEERWKRDFPRDLMDARIRAYRSKHFIIIGDSSGGKKFGKIMDEHYELIREVYPFEEVEGRKLLPIFLFRDRQSYIDFCVEYVGQSPEQAERSGGHAWKDYYATHYSAPGDNVHIHEATHQIFANRLFLNGGGSWFQESSAVHMEAVYDSSTRREHLNFGDNAVEDGQYSSFREFMQRSSLLHASGGRNNRGEDLAGLAYQQAGTMMEFVLHSKATREKAQEYIHAVGSLRRNDTQGIDRVLKRLWNVDIEGFEQLYLEYWEKPARKID